MPGIGPDAHGPIWSVYGNFAFSSDSCALTHLIELDASRDIVRNLIADRGEPQLSVRVGTAPQTDDPPPPTPRRELWRPTAFSGRDAGLAIMVWRRWVRRRLATWSGWPAAFYALPGRARGCRNVSSPRPPGCCSRPPRIESGVRQPSLQLLARILAAIDLELRISLDAYDAHDDILDADEPD